MASVLVVFFKRLNEGQKEFQPLVVNGVVLMDKQANLEDWAVQTVSNHRHTWESCHHMGVGSKGSHPKCKTICEFGGLEHDVCSRCGLKKHSSNPLEKVVYE